MQVAIARHLIKLFPPILVMVAACTSTPPADAATQGSGRVATETRMVSDFEAINLGSSMKLDVRQSGKEALSLSADDNLLPLIETVVESGAGGRTLHIRFKRGESIGTHREIKVVVDVIKLSGLSISGSGDIQSDALKGGALKLNISGSGDARLRGLAYDAVDVRIAGSGDVLGQGSAGQVTVSIAGSGDAKLADLVASDVNVNIAGSGDAKVHATQSLKVRIAGSGDVMYRGGASKVDKTVMGSGSVKPMK